MPNPKPTYTKWIIELKEQVAIDLERSLSVLSSIVSLNTSLNDKFILLKGKFADQKQRNAQNPLPIVENDRITHEIRSGLLEIINQLDRQQFKNYFIDKTQKDKISLLEKELKEKNNQLTTSKKESSKYKQLLDDKIEENKKLKDDLTRISSFYEELNTSFGKKLENFLYSELIRKEHNSWNSAIRERLKYLRDYWIEYIPDRDEFDCEFSIGKFGLDDYQKHEFKGTSYLYKEKKVHYEWQSQKVLAPVELDANTFCIYYLYQRIESLSPNNYGFGKLIAKKPNSSRYFNFTKGFFFNEEEPKKAPFDMKLKRLSDVAKELGMDVLGKEEDLTTIIELIEKIKQSGIHKKW